jgi:hypothetical protein
MSERPFGGKANNARCTFSLIAAFKQNQSYQFIYEREPPIHAFAIIAEHLLLFNFYLWKYPLPPITNSAKPFTFQGNFTVECTG